MRADNGARINVSVSTRHILCIPAHRFRLPAQQLFQSVARSREGPLHLEGSRRGRLVADPTRLIAQTHLNPAKLPTLNRKARGVFLMKPLTSVTFLFLASLASSVHAELKGDAPAIALAHQIVDSIGGSQLWSGFRSLHIVEKSRTTNGDGVIGEFWRDLVTPRERYVLKNRRGTTIEFWWDARGVSQVIDGKSVSDNLPDNIHEEVQAYWPGEIYIMYRRFATGDSDLVLKKNEGNSFTASSAAAGTELGTFWVNADGELYRWRHADGTEYIYGPHRQFGDISFPDWGTQVDGSWSFYYVEVRGSAEPPPVSFEPFR